MDLSLTEEQRSFRALAREFLTRKSCRTGPRGTVPSRWTCDRPQAGRDRFFGLTIPEEYGGIGGDYVTYCLGMEELGRADSSVRGIVSVSSGLVGKSILGHGTEEQKQQWLRPIATGEALGCFGLTEPGHGSDAGHLETRAVRDGGDYLLSGQKIFITNGTWADVCLVFARTGREGPRGVSASWCPPARPA